VINKRALYELYDQGPEPIIRLVENLMAHNVDIERQIGHEQKLTIQEMSGQIFKLKAQIERLKTKLGRQVFLNYELKRKLEAAEARLLKRQHCCHPISHQHTRHATVVRHFNWQR
jgi:hypothetical protein